MSSNSAAAAPQPALESGLSAVPVVDAHCHTFELDRAAAPLTSLCSLSEDALSARTVESTLVFRRCMARALDVLVTGGWLRHEDALDVGEDILRRNAIELYRLETLIPDGGPAGSPREALRHG